MSKWLRACLPPILAVISLQAQTSRKPVAMGTVENGTYHSNSTGIEFTLPTEWVIASQGPSAERDAQVIKLRDTVTNAIATVWLKERAMDPANIEALMNGRLDSKAMQRNNFESYKYRPESVQHSTIGGRPALSAVADYTIAGQKMVEYLTWVDGEKGRILFVGRVSPTDLADFQARFDPVIQSAIVP
jgi:hypothetical protein